MVRCTMLMKRIQWVFKELGIWCTRRRSRGTGLQTALARRRDCLCWGIYEMNKCFLSLGTTEIPCHVSSSDECWVQHLDPSPFATVRDLFRSNGTTPSSLFTARWPAQKPSREQWLAPSPGMHLRASPTLQFRRSASVLLSGPSIGLLRSWRIHWSPLPASRSPY